MGTERNGTKLADLCAQRIGGLEKHVAVGTEVLGGGTSLTLAQTIEPYQAALDARAELKRKRNEASVAFAQWEAAIAAVRARDVTLRAWVIAKYGPSSQEAMDIGFAPRKVTKPDAQTKARAVALARATRKARGTLGKRERLKIKGTLPEHAPEGDNGASPGVAASPRGVDQGKVNGLPSA